MAAATVSDNSNLREEGLFWLQIREISGLAYRMGVVEFIVVSLL